MPPFGPDWFGPLQDQLSPLGALRLAWIMMNIAEDNRLAGEERRREIEYAGLFNNPQVYFKIMDSREGRNDVDNGEDFKVVYDRSDYNRRLGLAMKGEPEIHERRDDVAELVERKRREAEERKNQLLLDDPRIHTPISVDGESLDDLIIEYPDPNK